MIGNQLVQITMVGFGQESLRCLLPSIAKHIQFDRLIRPIIHLNGNISIDGRFDLFSIVSIKQDMKSKSGECIIVTDRCDTSIHIIANRFLLLFITSLVGDLGSFVLFRLLTQISHILLCNILIPIVVQVCF